MLKILNYLGISLLLFSTCAQAQSGYNYARPEIANVAGGGVGSSNVLRPIVPVGSNTLTASPTSPLGFPSTAGTAYGGTGGAAATPFPSFGTQPSALGATGQGAYSGATSGAALQVGGGFNAAKRPILAGQQRSGGGGVFSGGLTGITSGRSAYGNAPRVSGLNDVDYSGEGDYSAIPGVPAVDYPVYAEVPQTNFDCAQQLSGYYSDVEAQCQVFHICALNRTYSFICPNGTIFSQETLVCVWWNQFECATAPALYGNNAYIYDYGSEQRTAGVYSSSGGAAALGARQPTSYPGAGSGSSLRATSATLPSAGGIFGAANLRPTAFGAIPSTVTPVPSTAGYNANTGRFPTASAAGGQSFNTAVAPISVAQSTYGSGGVGVGGGSGVPTGTSNSNANSNREYLPPSQRQRRP
ncbi:nuclear pore complex protein Nup214 [Bactrocera oleae]|uniref:nuclear pore complex protein Nup214 n=1 Tax=Bactrocera oleae TaxID=104688 RepID=UPI00387EC770